MSRSGVPSIMSTSWMCNMLSSTSIRRTTDSPMGLGLEGARVENKPWRFSSKYGFTSKEYGFDR